jgi:hypothetical protein
MARDFRAKQLRTSVIIGSGSIESNRPHLGLVFYSASKASDFDGTRRTGGSALSSATQLNLSKDAIALPHRFGDDVWCLFDGQSVSQNAAMTTERTVGSTVLFLGDVAISGSLFAERQMIEVDTTTAGNFRTPIGSAAFFDGGFASSGVDITAGGEIKAFASVRSPIFLNDSANVTLKTTTSGDVDIHPISGITKFKFDANSFSTLTVTNASHTTLATAESGNLTLDSAGTVVLDAASTAAASISLNSAGGVAIDSAAGPISIDTTYNNAAAINITSNGGTSEKILIKNTQGDTEAAAADGAIKIEAAAGGIGLDAALDIRMSAAGGNVIMDDGTNSIFDFDTANAIFTVYDDADTDGDRDYFRVKVTANGHATLSTHSDSDASSCNLDLLADGDINFDATGGYIGFRKGTADISALDNEYAYIKLNSSAGLNDFQWYGYGNGSSATASINLLSFTDSKKGASTAKPTIRVSNDIKLEFHDASQYIHAPSDNNISVVAPNSITLNAGAAGSTLGPGAANSGAILAGHTGIHVGGTGTGAGIASIAANASPIRIFKAVGNVYNADPGNTSEANFPFNGDGSSGGAVDDTVVAEAGDLVISNRSAINSTTGIAEGKIVFDGAVEYNTINTTGNVIVGGNLTVNGTTTTVNSATITVDDPILTLGGDTAPGSDDNKDRGIEFRYHDGSAARVGFMGWDDSLSGFALYNAATNNTEVFSGTKSNLTVGKLLIDGATDYIDVSTNLTLVSSVDILLDPTGGDVKVDGNIVPNADEGGSVGSANLNWSDLYLADAAVLNFGDNQDVTFTHVHDTGVLLNSGKQIQFGHADENISGNGTDLTIASGGDINLTAAGDVNIPASKGLTFGADTNKIEVDGTPSTMTVITANDMTLQTGGADADKFLFRNGGDTTEETKVCIGDVNTYIERQGGSNNIAFVSDRPIQLDCGGTLTLDGNSGVNIKHGDTATLSVTRSTDTILLANHANDIVFKTNDGGIAEFMRLDTSAEELVLPQGHKITFDGVDGGESIYADGSQNLQFVAGGDINLTPGGNDVTISSATAQLNFNSSNQRIYLDSNEIKFRDGVQTTAKSLSDLASVAPADGVLLSATGPNRAKSSGAIAISSLNKYVNETGLQGAPVSSDLFFYVGDDASSRTNAAFKNDVAVSGSMRLVDNSDGLSQSKLLQNADNLIFRMNRNTAAATEASHDIMTIESASGLKLGTTVGSGNAGLYFQEAGLNLQKVTATVEGSSQSCIQSQGHIIPQADSTFNLGTADRRFANLYTGDLHLCNEGGSNDVDGTSGNWTVQEGEDNLYVINNLTGKKFKMMLQPVEDEE